MPFMQPDVYYGPYFSVEANHGETHIVPAEVLGGFWGEPPLQSALADYVEGTLDSPDEPAELREGWLARMSAPGYMDCTDWSVHESEAAARAYLAEHYGEDDTSDNE